MTAKRQARRPETSTRGSSGGEIGIIRRIQERVSRGTKPSRELVLGIGDDCAILRPRSGEELVVTTDFSLETRHFRREWHSPQSVGHRTLARGLSDIAAMGGRPVAAFLSLALPRRVAQDLAWLDGFLEGLLGLARRAPVPVAGGDTSESPGDEVLADMVLIGAVPRGRALRRDGARPGDRLYVTGALGGAAAQLEELLERSRTKAFRREQAARPGPHFFPEPRLKTGQQLLRGRRATAAIDLSDGLSTDLNHLCAASGVSAEVNAEAIPTHALLTGKDEAEAQRLALHGGEDYELLFTGPADTKLPRDLGGVPITEIGRIVERRRGRPRVALVNATGMRTPLFPGGWEHLR